MTSSLQPQPVSTDMPNSACFGDCADCGRRHALPIGNARALALDLLHDIESAGRLDFDVPEHEADPRYSLDNVIRPGHGNMFGILECESAEGETVVLRAFSSLRHGIRRIDGWVLPLLSASLYDETILPAQDEIKRLTTELNAQPVGSREHQRLQDERRNVSRDLWEQMCAAYRFRNFRGGERSLADAVVPGTPITGGMGECCAPKLLNHAAIAGLRPISMAEFYWGSGPQHGSRIPGEFYESCEARCQPILGYMLCGLEAS